MNRRRRLHRPGNKPKPGAASLATFPSSFASLSPLPHQQSLQKSRVLVLGTGFAAFAFIKHLGFLYDLTIVSPRNHFLFTPLLPSTTVGTIEFRSIIEPIRHARRALRFLHARALTVDFARRRVRCEGAVAGERFDEPYDVLVIAVGAVSNTFGIPGVEDHALFLKSLNDARVVRQRIIQCFERANLPGISDDQRRQLLHFVVCGGGPTGVEFAAELHDFLVEDLHTAYPTLTVFAHISLVEASTGILNTFDAKLRRYAEELFGRERIHVLKGSPVIRVSRTEVVLKNGTVLSYGLLLWSTGNGATHFTKTLPLAKDGRDRLVVDEYFRVLGNPSVFALGDCARMKDTPLPETAQVAQQEGKYLARSLDRLARGVQPEPFRYRHLGMLAYIGGNKALADLQNFRGYGWWTWLFWRSAYLTRIVSLKNKVLVLFDWIKTQFFGRDVSQF